MSTIARVRKKAGKPVARLMPVEKGVKPKTLGLLRGRIRVSADFSRPLSPEELADFEGALRPFRPPELA